MSFERMLNREHIPGRDDIADYLGKDVMEAWDDIVSFIEANYNFTPETAFGGKKYGWETRYRRSGRSLCTLYPEKDAFTIQIVIQAMSTLQQAKLHITHINSAFASLYRDYKGILSIAGKYTHRSEG